MDKSHVGSKEHQQQQYLNSKDKKELSHYTTELSIWPRFHELSSKKPLAVDHILIGPTNPHPLAFLIKNPFFRHQIEGSDPENDFYLNFRTPLILKASKKSSWV